MAQTSELALKAENMVRADIPHEKHEKKEQQELDLNALQIMSKTGKYSIFFSTLSKNIALEQSGTGDIDYTNTIAQFINQKYPFTTHYIRGAKSESEVYNFIENHKAKDLPVLHLILNAPHTGFGFTEAGLKVFKERGKLVMTVLEFKKHQDPSLKADTLKFIQYADVLIFLDEFDKNDALSEARKLSPIFPALVEKIEIASVIPVPATVHLKLLPIEERGRNVGFFGILRKGQGLRHVINFANYLNAQKISYPVLKDRKVLIIGTALEADKLIYLMTVIYPDHKKTIKDCGQDIARLKNLLEELKLCEKKGELTPDLPIDLYVNVPERDLPALFNQCSFFFQPKYRGASFRFSSISTLLSLGFNIISHQTEITPEILRNYNENTRGMILCNESIYLKPSKEFDNYALYAVCLFKKQLIDSLEADSNTILKKDSLILKTSKNAEMLYKHFLNPEILSKELVIIYNRMFKCSLDRLIPTDLSSFIGESCQNPLLPALQKKMTLMRAFKHWREKGFIFRSYKEIHNKIKVDIQECSEKSLTLIKKRLYDFESQNICPRIKAYLLTQIGTDSRGSKEQHRRMLARNEAFLYRLILDYDLQAKHVTHPALLDYIERTSKCLLSVSARTKRKIETLKHTPDSHGLTDQVFFSIGDSSNKAVTAYFVDHFNKVINFNLKKIAENAPLAMQGAWISDHWHSYNLLGNYNEMRINDVTIRIGYKTRGPLAEIIRVISFILPDNKTTYQQEVLLGDEVFSIEKMQHAMALLTIDMIRHLGIETYEKIMELVEKIKDYPHNSEAERISLKQILQIRFNPGLWELHQPNAIQIFNQPGVTIEDRLTPKCTEGEFNRIAFIEGFHGDLMASIVLLDNWKQIKSEADLEQAVKRDQVRNKIRFSTTFDIFKAILIHFMSNHDLSRDVIKTVLNSLDKHHLIQQAIEINSVRVNLLGVAIMSGDEILLESLLSLGPHIDPNRYRCFTLKNKELSCIALAAATANQDTFNSLFETIDFWANIKKSFDHSQTDKIFKLLFSGPYHSKGGTLTFYHSARVTPQDIAIACYHLSDKNSDMIQFLLSEYKYNPNRLSLCWSVLTRNLSLVKKLQALGADDGPIQKQHFESCNLIPIGVTSLQCCLLKDNGKESPLLEFLLDQIASKDKLEFEKFTHQYAKTHKSNFEIFTTLLKEIIGTIVTSKAYEFRNTPLFIAIPTQTCAHLLECYTRPSKNKCPTISHTERKNRHFKVFFRTRIKSILFWYNGN